MGMKVIYKYPLNPLTKNQYTTIQVPRGSEPIHFGKDPHDKLCVWIERPVVYEMLHMEQFLVVGTGMEFDNSSDGWKHFQSIQDGPFMWHCYHFKR